MYTWLFARFVAARPPCYPPTRQQSATASWPTQQRAYLVSAPALAICRHTAVCTPQSSVLRTQISKGKKATCLCIARPIADRFLPPNTYRPKLYIYAARTHTNLSAATVVLGPQSWCVPHTSSERRVKRNSRSKQEDAMHTNRALGPLVSHAMPSALKSSCRQFARRRRRATS